MQAKVMHIIDTGGPGGAETVFMELASAMDPALGTPCVVVSREGWLAEQLRGRGLEVTLLTGSGSFDLRYLMRLIQIIRAQRVQLVVAHLFGAMVYAGIASRCCRVPAIGVLHGQTDLKGRFASLKAWIVRNALAHVVFVSTALRDAIDRTLKIPHSRSSVITNGVDTDRFAPGDNSTLRDELQVPATRLLVGAIGNIRRPKGYDLLLQAWQLVRQQGIDAHLVIAGEGQGELLAELHQIRKALNIEDSTTLLGLRSDIVNILRGLDLFVSSSTSEGFSIACIEAMACATPVLATRSGGPETIISNERNGLLVDANDSKSLALGIIRLLNDAALRTCIAAEGRKHVIATYSRNAQLRAYERIGRQLLRQSTGQ